MIDIKSIKCKFAYSSSASEIESDSEAGKSCNALKLLKNRLSQSQIIANYATWEWNSDSDEIIWSDNLFKILQYDPEEVTPSIKALFKRIHPEDLKRVHQKILNINREDKTNEIEFRIILSDESIRTIYCYTSVTYDPVTKSNSSIIGTVQDITTRKQAELALRESEIKFRNLVEGSLQGIFVHRDFAPLFANQKCADIFGYKNPDEILKLESILTAFWSEEEQDRINKYRKDRMAGKKDVPITYECKGKRKDGSEFWFENYVTTVDWNGEKAIQAAVIDITERKQTEIELSESEERYRNIIAIEPECVKTIDADGILLSMNSAGLNYIEADSFDEVDRACVYDLVIEEDRDIFIKLNELVFQGKTVDAEFRIEGLKGTQRWMETHAVPVYKKGSVSEVIAHLAITRDITERKKNEDILLESEERFRSSFEYGPLGMGMADLEGNILQVNKVLCDIVGYSEDEIISKNLKEFVHPDDVEVTFNNLKRLLLGEIDHYQQKRRYLHKQGYYVWTDNNVAVIKDSEGKPKLLINHLQDISERVQSEYLQEAQQKILKQIVKGDSQEEILTSLCLMFETYAPVGAKASVLLLNAEDKKLYVGAAPSLTDVLRDAFTGFIIGKNKASCGTAAYLGETVIVDDVVTSEYWKEFKDFAVENGILACWSTPFFAENGDVLGTFAISHPKQIAPSEYDLERLQMAGYLASIVVIRTRSLQALLNSENKFSTAFRSIPHPVTIASFPDGKFLEVNSHFIENTGFKRHEVINHTDSELGLWVNNANRDSFINELKEHGVVRDMETQLRNRSGIIQTSLVSAEVFKIDHKDYYLVINKDITEQKRLEDLKSSRNLILEALAKNQDIDGILRVIVESTAGLITESSVSILQTDKEGKHLLTGAAYNLPDFFIKAINGLEISTSSCPCTRAANIKKRILIEDLNVDPDCAGLIELVQQANLSACWVTPIISSQNKVLGTFTLYFDIAKKPNEDEIEIIDSMSSVAAIAIERKRDEEILRESEARFRSAFGDAPMGTALIDEKGTILQVNARCINLIGFLPEEIIGMSIADVTHPDDIEESIEKYQRLMSGEIEHYQFEKRYLDKSGEYVWCRFSISSVKDDNDVPLYSIAHIEDISERKQSEQSLHRYNRALQVLNQCNATLFHATNEDELLNEVCNIIVNTGGYRFAWVGYVQADENQTILPMAKSGYEDGYLKSEITLMDNDKYYCSLTKAIKSLEAQTIRNIRTDEAQLNWRDAALKRGYLSTISLPLISENISYGAISIYADEVDVFDEEELELLKNLADNVSFGIKSITNRAVREEAEKLLRHSEQKFRTLFDENPCMFFTIDDSGAILAVNKYGAAELGYESNQIIGRTLFSLTDDGDIDLVNQNLMQCLQYPDTVFRWEMQVLRKNGTKFWIRVLARVANDENHENTILVVCEDITDAHLLSEKLKHEATHDGLTGLINRREFEDRLERALASAKKSNQHVLCYLDLDRFKVINDSCGHVAGDKLLKQLSDLLHSNLRSRDSLARLGGDEFGLLIENCTVNQAEKIANKIKDEITNFQFYWEDKVFKVGASIGMVEINTRSVSVSDILMVADNACYTAKDKGRDRIHVHKEGDAELESRRKDMLWTTRIQKAFDEDRFRLAYQTIIPIDQNDDKGEHGEILVRMEDEDGNIIPPNTFIPVAERYNLITSIDKHVIDMTFKWLSENNEFLKKLFLISINLSGPSLVESDVLKWIVKKLIKYNIPANKICFEITETSAIANLSKANHFISVLKEHGCYFALDDFGSGLSSFAYLKALQVDFLKIDSAFVRDIENEKGDLAIVKSIHEIGRALDKKTIAEFVENDSILQILKGIGVNYAQGYGIAHPRPLIDINNKSIKTEVSKKAS